MSGIFANGATDGDEVIAWGITAAVFVVAVPVPWTPVTFTLEKDFEAGTFYLVITTRSGSSSLVLCSIVLR